MAVLLLFSMLLFSTLAYGQGHYGVLYAEVPASSESSKFCMTYDPQYNQLPSRRYDAVHLLFKNFTTESYELFCDSTVEVPWLNGSAVAVMRGNCTFSEKALMAQQHGAQAVIIVSEQLIPLSVNSSISSKDVLNITVAMITEDTFDQIIEYGSSVVVSMYAPESKRSGLNLLVIWLLALITVAAGAYWSGLIRYQLWLNQMAMAANGNGSSTRRNDVSVELTTIYIFVAVIMMCAMLLGLYFFYDYLVYVIMALFLFGACVSLQECLIAICQLLPIPDLLWCKLPSNRIPLLRKRPYILSLIMLLISVGVGIWWIVVRHSSYAWILQDILGIAFCIKMMTSIRLASLKTCSILLVLLFFYDIFFVFITPLFTKDGHSVMIDAATGRSSHTGEMLPVVLIVPNLRISDASVCMLPYSLLGFGDMLAPGLLVSFCHGFDLQVNSRRVYYISNVFAYGAGLLVTDLALILTGSGQPALLYLVPFALVTTFVVAWQRKEVKQLWTGRPFVTLDTTLGRSESSLPTSTPPPRDDDQQPTFGDQFRHKLMD